MYRKYILINNINGEIMIKDIMSKKIIFSNIDSSIKDVSNLMKENNIQDFVFNDLYDESMLSILGFNVGNSVSTTLIIFVFSFV